MSVAIGISGTLYGAGAMSVLLVLAVLAVPAVRNFPDGAGPPITPGRQPAAQ